MNILIDATQRQGIIFSSGQRKKIYSVQSEEFLFSFLDFLKKEKIDLQKIEALGVLTGQGSFTGQRIAAVMANALGQVLKIKLYQFKLGEKINWQQKPVKIIDPHYGSAPNITRPKK